jgi:hypothetical protein
MRSHLDDSHTLMDIPSSILTMRALITSIKNLAAVASTFLLVLMIPFHDLESSYIFVIRPGLCELTRYNLPRNLSTQ